MKKQKFLDVNVINLVDVNIIIIWIILDSKETTVFECNQKMLNHHAAHLSVCLCLHIQAAACVKGEEDDQEEEKWGGGCKMKHETRY